MLDSYIRPRIDPCLNAIGKRIASYGIAANSITVIGFLFGIAAMIMIAMEQYSVGAIFIACNRLLDGLDGAVARNSILSDFGGFLDIVCDFIIYAGIVFAFGTHQDNALYAAFLIFSFIGPMVSFLAYAIIAAKRQINTTRCGKKSFYYLGGVCEGTETAFVLFLFCLYPQYFATICIAYGVLCWLTTLGRIYRTWVDFGKGYDFQSSFNR